MLGCQVKTLMGVFGGLASTMVFPSLMHPGCVSSWLWTNCVLSGWICIPCASSRRSRSVAMLCSLGKLVDHRYVSSIHWPPCCGLMMPMSGLGLMVCGSRLDPKLLHP